MGHSASGRGGVVDLGRWEPGAWKAWRSRPLSLLSRSEEETEALGRNLAGQEGLSALALCGDLGAGKTALVRGVARGLGIEGPVQSPTFVLARTYPGRRKLWHLDFYRLEKEGELDALDFPSREEGVLAAVEWADKFPDRFPEATLWLGLKLGQGDEREIRIGGPAPR